MLNDLSAIRVEIVQGQGRDFATTQAKPCKQHQNRVLPPAAGVRSFAGCLVESNHRPSPYSAGNSASDDRSLRNHERELRQNDSSTRNNPSPGIMPQIVDAGRRPSPSSATAALNRACMPPLIPVPVKVRSPPSVLIKRGVGMDLLQRGITVDHSTVHAGPFVSRPYCSSVSTGGSVA